MRKTMMAALVLSLAIPAVAQAKPRKFDGPRGLGDGRIAFRLPKLCLPVIWKPVTCKPVVTRPTFNRTILNLKHCWKKLPTVCFVNRYCPPTPPVSPAVPEPGSLALLGSGLVALVARFRRAA